MLALAPARLLPAHGRRSRIRAAIIRRYIDHRPQREAQVLSALEAGLQTVDAIVERIYVGLSAPLVPMARESVLAHLHQARGRGPGEASTATSGPRRASLRWRWRRQRSMISDAVSAAAMDKIVDFINVNRDRYVDELKEYLAIPSISALPQHAADVRRCAEWTADEMRRIGLQNVRLEETPGHPVVYGEWLGAEGAPTILFYGHYDVQPVDPLNLWTSPPFEATIRDGEIYARGSADDKGQVFMHFKAVEAHMKRARAACRST